MNECPDDGRFAQLAAGTLPVAERAALLQHLEGCTRCRKTAALLLSTQQSLSLSATVPAALPTELEPGVALGPYHLVRELGSGAMGTVYLAWDPRLERQVAIKVLRDESAQLMGEARLMARLSHPNIVTVLEVAEWQGRLVLVMEYVNGPTLRQWLTTSPRDVDAVVRLFTQCGQGLAAAHQAGIVHRDFKPDNVLVDGSGRAQLTDFGLSTLVAEVRAGEFAGTPAYLAPAQLTGAPADERSDQFSFCVALFEALAGGRPFTGKTLEELKASQRAPLVVPSQVPRWLVPVLRRGLSLEPQARFESMASVVEHLRRGPRRVALSLVAGLVIALAGVGAWAASRVDPCAGAGSELEPVLASSVFDRLDGQFSDAGLSTHSLVSAETVRLLREWTGAWQAEARAACDATLKLRTTPKAVGEAQQQCLEVRRAEFESLVDSLSRANQSAAEAAITSTLGLVPPESCRQASVDPNGLATREARREVALLRSLVSTGRYQEVTPRLEALRPQVSAVDGGALAAEFGWLDAQFSVQRYQVDRIRPTSTACVRAALGAHADVIAAECLLYRVTLHVTNQTATDAALARMSFDVADALLARTPHGARNDVNLEYARVLVTAAEGDPEKALTLAAAATERFSQTHGARHPYTVHLLSAQALEESRLELYAASRTHLEQVLAETRRTAGDGHPRTLNTLHNLAFVSLRNGQPEQSLSLAQEVLTRRTSVLGPDNYATATAGMLVGQALEALGKDDEARTRLEHAVMVVEKARGVVHVDLAEPLEALARLDLKAGQKARALERWERAVSCRRALNGYPQRLARALLRVAELTSDSARAVASEAVTLFEKAGPRFSAERAEAQRLVDQRRAKVGP
jgi:eukaryotic-like serine/threonine-protein kinase